MQGAWVQQRRAIRGGVTGDLSCALAPIGVWYATSAAGRNRSRVRLDASLAEVIRCEVPVETVVGTVLRTRMTRRMTTHRAVQEYNGTDRYSGYFALMAEKALEPDTLDIRAPQYLLAGASKARMNYARRFAQVGDWTACG